MNCFGVLARAPRKSIVSASDQFFNRAFPSNWFAPTVPEEGSAFMTYTDDFTARLVRVIADYYAGDPSGCSAGLEALEFHPSAREKNNEDKLLLLRARVHRRDARTSLARATYELLQYHPSFGTEAEEYLHG